MSVQENDRTRFAAEGSDGTARTGLSPPTHSSDMSPARLRVRVRYRSVPAGARIQGAGGSAAERDRDPNGACSGSESLRGVWRRVGRDSEPFPPPRSAHSHLVQLQHHQLRGQLPAVTSRRARERKCWMSQMKGV